MAPAKTKNTNLPAADFRKVKAKVGKRAVRPANVTDTAFKSASIRRIKDGIGIAGGSGADVSGGSSVLLFVTARGKSLGELTTQLRHPAPAVRQSAARGLRDLVTSVSSGSASTSSSSSTAVQQQQLQLRLLEANLSVVVPAVARCCVDEDDGVRAIGSSALSALLKTLSSTSSTSTSASSSSSGLAVLVPFGPVLVAFLASGLNSLDASARRDAAYALQTVASASAASASASSSRAGIPSLVSPSDVVNLLPAFVRLLSERTGHGGYFQQQSSTSGGGGGGGAAVKKRKRKQQQSSANPAAASDNTTTAEGTNSGSGGGSSSGSNSSGGFSLLRALLSLLETTATSTTTTTNSEARSYGDSDGGDGDSFSLLLPPPDLTVGEGGRRALAAVVLAVGRGGQGQGQTVTISPVVRSVADMVSVRDHRRQRQRHQRRDGGHRGADRGSSRNLPTKTGLGLLEKLHDVLIEASQARGDDTSAWSLSAAEMEAYLTVIKNLRVFFRAFGGGGGSLFGFSQGGHQQRGDAERRIQLVKVCRQVVELMLEGFPLQRQQQQQQQVATSTSDTIAEQVNAEICVTVCAIASSLQMMDDSVITTSSSSAKATATDNDRKRWIKKIASYVKSSLAGLGRDDGAGQYPSQRRCRVLDVFRQLVVDTSDDQASTLLKRQNGGELRKSLVQTFCSTFFSTAGADNDLARIRSNVTRQAVRIGCELLRELDFDLEGAEAEFGPSTLVEMVRRLSEYLTAWDGDFVSDSCGAACVLLDVVRRTNTDEDVDDSNNRELLEHLRTNLAALVEPSPPSAATATAGTSSILERYPERLQRMVVSLLVMLDRPSQATIGALGKVCARSRLRPDVDSSGSSSSGVSTATASFIVQSVHSIRRSIPMQVYLSFLVDSTGLLSVKKSMFLPAADSGGTTTTNDSSSGRDPWKRLLVLDGGLEEVCRCFVECGSAKVLPKLQPLLSLCLGKACERSSSLLCDLVQLRAAIAILTLLSLDVTQGGRLEGSAFSSLPESFDKTVVEASVTFVRQTREIDASTDREESRGRARTVWVRPLVELLLSEPRLLPQVAEALNTSSSSSGDAHGGGEDPATTSKSSNNNGGVQVLLDVLGAPELATIVVVGRASLVETKEQAT